MMQQRSTQSTPNAFVFSGHETFILRANWLKKAYDLLLTTPDLFFREDAFVLLGVGKNMANAVRFWGRACGVFERTEHTAAHRATWLGDALLADQGWDPFLVMPAGRWLLHWQIVAHPERAFSWYFTFNLLRRGEFSTTQLGRQIIEHVQNLGLRPPSIATISRDLDCLLRCYLRPKLDQAGAPLEDALHCPLHELELIQRLPDQTSYRLLSGTQADLPAALVALAALQQSRRLGRATLAFNDLAYGECSPGRMFRLDEEALLSHLYCLEELTAGQATYSEHGGIRQLLWREPNRPLLDRDLITLAFTSDRTYA